MVHGRVRATGVVPHTQRELKGTPSLFWLRAHAHTYISYCTQQMRLQRQGMSAPPLFPPPPCMHAPAAGAGAAAPAAVNVGAPGGGIPGETGGGLHSLSPNPPRSAAAGPGSGASAMRIRVCVCVHDCVRGCACMCSSYSCRRS